MKINLDELERLAKAATPGPWEGFTLPMRGRKMEDGKPQLGLLTVGGTSLHRDDAAYIAAANPQTVLALVAAVRAAADIHAADDQGLSYGRYWYALRKALEAFEA